MNFKLKTSQYCWICVVFLVGYSDLDAQLELEVVSKNAKPQVIIHNEIRK